MAGENSYEEETTTELVEKTFEVTGLRVRSRTNAIEPGVAPRMEEVGVWISRDIFNGPPVWLGKSEPLLEPALYLNAAKLDSEVGIARITQKLTSEHLLSLEEATRVVEEASVAAGLREVEQTLKKDRLLLAAAVVLKKREEAKTLALAAGREALRLEMGAEAMALLMPPEAKPARTSSPPSAATPAAAAGSSLAGDEDEESAAAKERAAADRQLDVLEAERLGFSDEPAIRKPG